MPWMNLARPNQPALKPHVWQAMAETEIDPTGTARLQSAGKARMPGLGPDGRAARIPEWDGARMSASIHDKLNRVRKPRVHITYEVETEGAMIMRELPFVVGVLGDFSGDPTVPLKPLSERKFVQIDRDNFNDVMSRIGPGLNLKVDNTLAGDGSQMAVDLKFKSMDDFEPGRIVEQVPALKALMETRNKLRDLMSKVDRSEELENVLEQVLQNQKDLEALSSQLGIAKKE
jgi:type VI secretion system protein ImpB